MPGGAPLPWPHGDFPHLNYPRRDQRVDGRRPDFAAWSNCGPPSSRDLTGFRQGLRDTGYVENQNLKIEYQWANDDTDQLPKLAADLVRRRVRVIVSIGSNVAARAAKAAKLRRRLRYPQPRLRGGGEGVGGRGHEPSGAQAQRDEDLPA